MSGQKSVIDWKAVFDSAPIGICIIEDGKLRFVNPQLEKITGCPRKDLEGRKFWELVHPKDTEEFKERALRELTRLSHSEDAPPYEVRLVNGAGEIVWVEWISTAIRYNGKPSILGNVLDITERKLMQGRLIRTERLRALGEMISGIAHNFNNLLVAVLGYSELLCSETDPERVSSGLERISEAGRRARDLIWQLQESARVVQDQSFVPVDLAKVVRETVASTRPRWRDQAWAEGIAIEIEDKLEGDLTLEGNPVELGRMVRELIFNAVDAMPRGGTIIIRAERKGEEILLCVSDTGTGMNENIKDRIFDPLFTTKMDIGSGMGLAIAYGTIQRHGGEISVDSESGVGTTFTIKFPAASRAMAPSVEKNVIAPREAKILALDDEEDILNLLSQMLVRHRVDVATDGERGLELFGEDGYDVVIVDLSMPGMNGWQVANRVREMDPNVGIVVCTGWDVELERVRLQESPIDLVLMKPFGMAGVRNTIGRAIALRDERAQFK